MSNANPELRQNIATIQTLACRFSGVVEAIANLENKKICENGKCALIYIAEEIAGQLFTGLDSVNLPAVVASPRKNRLLQRRQCWKACCAFCHSQPMGNKSRARPLTNASAGRS